MAKKILIIDDDHSLLRLVQMLLTRKGYDVSVSLSSPDGREMLTKEGPVDAIILDLMMPNENGFTFLEWLDEQDEQLKNIPVVVNTAKNLQEEEVNFLNKHCKKIVLKGVNFTERLVDEIQTMFSDEGK